MKTFAVAAVIVGLGVGLSGQSPTPVYKVGDPGVTTPVVVSEKKPSYTAEAMRQKIQGSIELQAVIDTTGKPTDIKVLRSLDAMYGLDANALAALAQWRFKPAMREGKAVPFLVKVELTFTLRDGPMKQPAEQIVEIEGTVGTDGTVTDVRVVRGITPDLDMQAIEAFKASTFKPALIGGRAVPYRVTMRFPFPVRN